MMSTGFFLINEAAHGFSLDNWQLKGEKIINSQKKIKDLQGVFGDEAARRQIDPETLVYQVQAFMPVPEGTGGGLFFGNSTIFPGKVGSEFFMTRGHLHAQLDRAEFYWGIQGAGILILMDKDRNTLAERMAPGSLHYINGYTAHRVANVGSIPLIFGACWPSDAGHNYDDIQKDGFSARLLDVDGKPQLVKGGK